MKTQNAAQTIAKTGIYRSRVCALHDFFPDQTYSIFKNVWSQQGAQDVE